MRGRCSMRKSALLVAVCGVGCTMAPAARHAPSFSGTPGVQEAPAAFDDASNGMVDEATHHADRTAFDEVEQIADGLGPLYNAQACQSCHQNPTSGGSSQVTVLRAGHRDAQGRFVFPSVPIAGGAVVITGRTLINDRAICPNGTFPDQEIQERVPDAEDVRTFRLAINLLGDGYIEAVPDQTLLAISTWQCRELESHVCGKVILVPVLEAPGTFRAGRFGWKDQHASLLSFAADAYLNELGITNRLLPAEVTTLCDTVKDPEDQADSTGVYDVDRFARFIRASKAPPRDRRLAATPEAKNGAVIFDSIGCATCHVPTLVTAPAGTALHGGTYVVPPALGSREFHPFSDFLMHDVGTGDGIVLAGPEHHGRSDLQLLPSYEATAYSIRTAALWGLRMRSRLMHDGQSVTVLDAILRHQGEAADARSRFQALAPADREQVLTFLRSL
jgi:CxxC motif-containing protein (DUF1111 family)